MGTLRAFTIDPKGYAFNRVTLGEPVELNDDPATFEWNDSRIPNGLCEVVESELIVTPDEVEGM
jgi:hypothetical protein